MDDRFELIQEILDDGPMKKWESVTYHENGYENYTNIDDGNWEEARFFYFISGVVMNT